MKKSIITICLLLLCNQHGFSSDYYRSYTNIEDKSIVTPMNKKTINNKVLKIDKSKRYTKMYVIVDYYVGIII